MLTFRISLWCLFAHVLSDKLLIVFNQMKANIYFKLDLIKLNEQMNLIEIQVAAL